jgi:WD40 repeat protein
MSDQHFDNKQPNQGAQGTFHGPVHTGPQVNQQGQTVQGDQYNAGRDVNVTHHHHGEPPLQFARPIPPAPPEDFVPRPHEFNQLLAHLCSSDSGPVAITAALAGAGGFGKTTLAKAICYDERVQAAFPAGVLWVEIGQEPGNLIGKVEDLVLHLTGARQWAGFTDLNAAATRLAQALGERRLLLVIDDVWDSAHLQPFLEGGPHCTRLVTTRLPHVLPATARNVLVDAMQQQEAVALLGFGLPDAAAHTATLQRLAQRLGEWALLLKLVNGALREQVEAGSPLAEAFAFVTAGLDEEGISAFNLEHQEGRHAAVDRTIALSLRLLTSDEQARYAELAVFPEDVAVPLATVTRYWHATGTLSGFKVQRLCSKLARLSLLLGYDLAAKTIRLHDVVRSYLQHTHAANLTTWHAALLDAHRLADGWPTLPADEPYLWRHLAEHLADAGRTDELAALLTDFGWLQARLEATDINALLADYDALKPLPEPHKLVRDALRLSSHVLAEDTKQLASQLHGRICSFEEPAIAALLAQAADWKTEPWLCPLHACLTPPGGPLLRTFTGHKGRVRSVAILPDGQRALSASDDRTLKLWNLATGTCQRTFIGHARAVTSIAVLSEGRQALSASWDGTLKLWDLDTGNCQQTFVGKSGAVECVVIFAAEQHALSASVDGTLQIWDIKMGTCGHTLRGHRRAVNDVAILPDLQQQLALSAAGDVYSDDDTTLKLWGLVTGTCLQTLEGHHKRVTSVAVLPDGQHALSGSGDGSLKLWHITSGQCLRTLEGHTHTVTSVAVPPNAQQRALSGSWDGTLRLWDIITGTCLCTLEGHSDAISTVRLLSDGKRALSASHDRTLKLWNISPDTNPTGLADHQSWINSIVVLPDRQHALSASADTTLKLWHMETDTCLRTFNGHSDIVRSVAVLSNGHYGLSAANDKTLKLWDIATGECLHTLQGHRENVTRVVILPDEKQFLSTSADGTLKLWEITTFTCLQTFTDQGGYVGTIIVMPDGQHILFGDRFLDGPLKLWNLETGACSPTSIIQAYPVNSLAVLPDGRRILSASDEGTLKLWDLTTGDCLRTFTGHSAGVWSVALVADGQRALSASDDRTLKLWDISTGACLLTFQGDSPFPCCAVSPDGRTVVAGDKAGGVSFLRLEGLA